VKRMVTVPVGSSAIAGSITSSRDVTRRDCRTAFLPLWTKQDVGQSITIGLSESMVMNKNVVNRIEQKVGEGKT
jgi:hypothetical protein